MANLRVVASRLARGMAVVTATAVVGASTWVAASSDRREQVHRTATFYSTMVPLYAHYRFVEWEVKGKPEPEREAAFTRLHDMYAPQLYGLIVRLRGLYVKLGQVGATRGDMVPQSYLDELARLQDGVTPEDFATVRRIIERDFNAKLEDIFEWIDPVPLGAASIGQAHAARLRDGSDVVVKVQYPLARHHFMLDFKTVRTFAEFAQPEFNPFWDELERQFMTGWGPGSKRMLTHARALMRQTSGVAMPLCAPHRAASPPPFRGPPEFNFEREAAMQMRIRDNILPYYGDRVYIARVHDKLVSRHVLVMERVSVRVRVRVKPLPQLQARPWLTHALAACGAAYHGTRLCCCRSRARSWWTPSRSNSPRLPRARA